mmetsp:Transcript_21324/g.35261  ORF Transcript_21324/g.35261 Transcript_21324/m.35261 type:complete len:632 (+) Transcript_21324:75-1970(+)|eukprot:CAMPEP_0119007994 /NCGR_PEP_ID=MMETSP1176-20130426/3384_1 /TAXON_ID=265551 /ORGANISM="Synedropsis recta cf, Strain CCMP1620" /LENGTH=631 /DNA_ID=CAMNT_0006960241 /DNA_START=75 /DNA_END=1970 /DNA_ORIENTATION=-
MTEGDTVLAPSTEKQEPIQEAPEPVSLLPINEAMQGTSEETVSPADGDVETPPVTVVTKSLAVGNVPMKEGDEKAESSHVMDDDDDDPDSEHSNPDVKKRRPLFLFLDSHGCGLLARFPERWPRVFWFTFGVVAPLWLLIFIATFCGYGLAALEAPQEIVTNDNRLEIKYRVQGVNNITNRIIEKTPRICMQLFAKNSTTPETFPQLDYEEGYYESAILLEQATIQFLNESDADQEWTIDGNELYEFMNQCGKNFQRYMQRIQSAGEVYIGQPDDLTFNWARCANDSSGSLNGKLTVDLPWIGEKTYNALEPEAQKAYYERIWLEDMKRINRTVYDSQEISVNSTLEETIRARGYAFLEATRLASAEDACTPNLHAGAWFFFTVMTTIGYGNQAPRNVEGRSMLYTVGFLSILVFAATTAGAGYIMTSLFDDLIKKGKLNDRLEQGKLGCLGRLGRPLLATVFWGGMYYSWLLLIAAYTNDWKDTRLGYDDFDFSEGYWFAFISTTTVGLGDVYLDPEVVVSQDLLVFSLLFLIGFIFLASFLGTLGGFLRKLEHVGGSSFQQNLEKTTFCCGHKVVKASYHVGEEVVKGGYHVGESVVKGGYHAGESAVKAGHHAYEVGHAKLHHSSTTK